MPISTNNFPTFVMNLELTNMENLNDEIHGFDDNDFSELSVALLNTSQNLILTIIANEFDSLNLENDLNNLDNQTIISTTLVDGIKTKIRNIFDRFIRSMNFSIESSVPTISKNTANVKLIKERYKKSIRKIRGSKKFLRMTNQDEKQICPICLEQMEFQKTWNIPKGCNHIIHPKCLQDYYHHCYSRNTNNEALDLEVKCPICRINLTE